MDPNYLTESDYSKILSFIAQIKEYNNDYQQHVLNLLKEIFGYKYMTFNLVNHNLKLCSPRLLNIPKDAIDRYYGYHYKTDIFNPEHQKHLYMSKNVVSITDIMSTSEFEKTEYYLDFLKKDMLYHELLLPLKVNNRLIGALGVFKPKDDNSFNNTDLAILNRLNEFIAKDLWTFLEYSNLHKECQTYSNYFNETPTGIIILDRKGSIMRYNRAAEIFAANLQSGESPYSSMQKFIYEIFSKFSYELYDPNLNLKFYYQSYKINIILNMVSSVCDGMEPVYMVFITEGNREKWETANVLSESYNLTARETEILELVKNGLSNEEIADNLYISIHTVKSHLENIFKKLQVKNRTAALHKINAH